VSLDGKEIHEITREFLRRLEISKERRRVASHEIPANPTLSADITGEFRCKFILFVPFLTLLNPCIKQFTLHTTLLSDLTKNFTPGVTKSVIHSIYHDAELDAISGDYTMKPSTNFMFPPWKEHKL
jgi:hypothetical protein